jgi:hypothetical protein
MHHLLIICAAIAAAASSARSEDRITAVPDNKLPEAVQSLLDKAEQIELFSLDPSRDTEKPKVDFHGWKVLGSTVIKDKVKTKALESVYTGIKESDGIAARCFIPRHGIRAQFDKKTVDLVICFECLQIQVFVDEERLPTILTARSPEPTLDQILKDAKVPLAPKSKDK